MGRNMLKTVVLVLAVFSVFVSAGKTKCPNAGCGEGCNHLCPFGFPCRSSDDCLSKSCTASYCDVGSPTKMSGPVKKPPASGGSSSSPSSGGSGGGGKGLGGPEGKNVWTLQSMKAGWGAFKIVDDSYGENNRKIVPDPEGGPDDVIQVFYPKGSYKPSANPRGGTGFYAVPADISKAKVVTLQYDMYFEPGFDFVLGGKLPGLYGGHAHCSGGNKALDCFSTRFMFRTNGAAEIYLYVPDKLQVPAFCKVPPQTVCNGVYGSSLGRGAWKWIPGKWTTVQQRITINTPGKTDGRVEVYNEGQKVIDFAQVLWRTQADNTFVGIDFETFFGGSSPEWASPKDQYSYFKGFRMTWE